MWVFSIDVSGANSWDVVGIFTKDRELALAIWQHRKEIYLSGWFENVEGVMDYIENDYDLNDYMPRGRVLDYMPNIDYTTYRYPSLTEEMEKRNHGN
mgnify:CR=1 FL=1